MENVNEAVKSIIYRMAQEKEAIITEDSNLFDEGIMDSLNILSLISILEEELSVKLTEEVMIVENFENIVSICKMIQKSSY